MLILYTSSLSDDNNIINSNNNNVLFNELKSDENEQYDQEGDNIEKELHNSSLWYFLTNNTKTTYQTRIDLILTIV